jgi:hypothetical protein
LVRIQRTGIGKIMEGILVPQLKPRKQSDWMDQSANSILKDWSLFIQMILDIRQNHAL